MPLSRIRRPLALLALVSGVVAAPVTAHQIASATDKALAKIVADATETLEGTVEELIIDDRILHTMQRYLELRLLDGSSVPLTGASSESLQRDMQVEVTGNRLGKSLEVQQIKRSAKVQVNSQSTIRFEGTLEIAHADDFAAGRSRLIYDIRGDSGAVTTLDVGSLPPTLQGGMRVSVEGQPAPDGVSVRPSRITILPPSSSRGARGDVFQKDEAVNTVLVILANFNGTATPSYTSAQAQQVMVTNATSVANYFNEVSFGQQSLNVTVTNWVTMSMSMPSTCNNSDWQGIGNAAATAAAAANSSWTSANYGYVVYLFPQVPACGWSGLAYIGSPHKAYINGPNSFVTQVITHEMGHNFGLWHAGSLDCGAASIGGACTVAEYGDPFDTMGNQRSMHFNAEQKSKLNWISAGNVATHSSGTVSYSLAPIESPGGSLYAVKIPTASPNRTYWVEFRQPIGFDSPLSAYPNNGAQIRVASPLETLCSGCVDYSNDTELLDMTPATTTFNDAALVAGQSFSDATSGVTINVLAATASTLTVQISMGGQATTTTTVASSLNPSTYGTTVTLTATITGNGPTGSVDFRDAGISIAGCASVSLVGSGNVRTAACSISGLASGTHSVVASYGGNAGNTSSTSGALSQVVNANTTTTGLATSANPSTAGASVTFTASVSGVGPTGMVNFTDGGVSVASCASVILTGSGNIRTATCSTSGLTAGAHSIAASYGGDAGNTASASGTLSQSVQAVSATSLASSANPSIAGSSITLTATVGGSSPTGSVNFTDGGASIPGCAAVVVVGSGNTRSAACATSTLGIGTHSIVASYSGDSGNTGSTAIALTQIVNASGIVNVALAGSGGVASASSSLGADYPATALNDGDLIGKNWGRSGGWADATPGSFPDWVQINFSSAKTIYSVVVYSLQDDFGVAGIPIDTTRFTAYGITDFDVQGWNGASWVTLASVNDNALVERTVDFAPFATDRIRINVISAFGEFARLVEVQAWGN